MERRKINMNNSPLIGITCGTCVATNPEKDEPTFRLNVSYVNAVQAAGGIPVAIPYARPETARELLSRLDGLILSGGEDIPADVLGVPSHPACKYLNKARWDSDSLWYTTARELGLPVLGICLGMQTLCVVSGAKLIADIPTEVPHAIAHRGSAPDVPHSVTIPPDSWLADIAKTTQVTVMSNHHQAVMTIPNELTVTALAPDGIIEAVESVAGSFAVGVQWHPERSPEQPDWLLRGFVNHCMGRA